MTGSNFSPASSNFFCSASAARVEFARRRALEREDRLLLVADREDRAHDAVARAFAGGEFGDDVRRRCPIAGGWCPAPRRSARDRRRGRACSAPSRTRRGRASPASCRSGRHSRAGRVPASRAGSSPPPRSRSAAAPGCGRAIVTARRRSISGRCGGFRASNKRPIAGLSSANFLVTTRFARRAVVGEEHAEISSTWPLPVSTSASRSRAAWS